MKSNMAWDREVKKHYVYRITDQDYNNRWAGTWRDAQKVQREMYRDGAERVSIAKEYQG